MTHPSDDPHYAHEASSAWSDLQEGVRADAERDALLDVMEDQALALPARDPVVVPLGRVLAVACLVPILAMIVLGASRFDSIYAIEVDPEIRVAPADVGASGDDITLPNLSQNALATDLYSASGSAVSLESPSGMATFRVKEVRMMEVTAYCPCTKCCGRHARGITASGKPVSYNKGRFVAADTRRLAFGSLLRIRGYHEDSAVEVIDRGGAIKGDKIDVFFPSHEEAREWGRQLLPVEILEPASEIADAQ